MGIALSQDEIYGLLEALDSNRTGPLIRFYLLNLNGTQKYLGSRATLEPDNWGEALCNLILLHPSILFFNCNKIKSEHIAVLQSWLQAGDYIVASDGEEVEVLLFYDYKNRAIAGASEVLAFFK